MIEALTTAVRRGWFTLGEVMNNPEELMTRFKLTPRELDTAINTLTGAVMEGIFEYKKGRITSILRPLESLQHDSRALERLPAAITEGRALVLVTLLQRLFCLGKLTLSSRKKGYSLTKEQEKGTDRSTEVSIKEILEYVREAVSHDPEKMKDTEIKKILMYSKMYQNEIKKLKNLAANIPSQKKELLGKNFKQSLKDLTVKLNTAYQLLRGEGETPAPVLTSAPHLQRYDYSPLAPLLQVQAKGYSEILSTLTFAKKEKFRTREILVGLARRQESFIQLVNREQEKYEDIDPFDPRGLKAGGEFAAEIVKYLRREREWLKLHPW